MKKFNFDLYKNDKTIDFERNIRAQLDELNEMIRANSKDISLIKDDSKKENEFVGLRLEQSEKIIKFNIDTIS